MDRLLSSTSARASPALAWVSPLGVGSIFGNFLSGALRNRRLPTASSPAPSSARRSQKVSASSVSSSLSFCSSPNLKTVIGRSGRAALRLDKGDGGSTAVIHCFWHIVTMCRLRD